MPFRVKDLMIDITSQISDTVHLPCRLSYLCVYYCSHAITNICTLTCTHIGSPVTPPTHFTHTFLEDPAGLKQQLKVALAAAEAAEKALATEQQPQTVADVEMLEKKLAEASEALRTRKAELQKQGGK